VRVRKQRAKDAAAGGKKVTDTATVVVQDRIEYLQRENEDLKRKLAEADAQMARWRHNSAMAKISLPVLDEPLQENNRGRSDRKKPAR
jgi:hypothetical protein